MAKKSLTSENDLTYNHSVTIREIVDHQLRQEHNRSYIADICEKVSGNFFFKKILKTPILFITVLIITNFFTYYSPYIFEKFFPTSQDSTTKALNKTIALED